MALNFTPHAVTGGHSTPDVPVDEVPEETRAEVEEAIGFFVANPEGMALRVEFPDNPTKQKWVGMAQSYAANRPESKGEPFVLRVSPGKAGADAKVLQFRMYPKAQQDAQAAERKRIRDAAKAAKAAEAANAESNGKSQPAKATARASK